MDLLQQFRDYAKAFEEAYASDDWSGLEPHFTEDAVYSYSDGSEPVSGRDAVIDKLKNAVNDLDRRMDGRDLAFVGMSADGDTVSAEWTARFSKDGLPPLEVTGVEIATFSGPAISELRSVIDESGLAAFGAWMAAHGDKL